MKASSKFMKAFSVTGLSLSLAMGCALQLHAQSTGEKNTGNYVVPQSAPPVADMNQQNVAALPASNTNTLLKARQALAAGDVETAKRLVETVRLNPSNQSSVSDTPERVEAMIARHMELVAMSQAGNLQGYNYGAALFLLEQADRLADYHDFQTATALLQSAQAFDVQYQAGDLTPHVVTNRIQQLKSGIATHPAVVSDHVKVEAGRIMAEAQLAYDKGQIDLATQLIKQVNDLNLPEDAFAGHSVMPWELELKIRQTAQSSGMNTAANGGLVQQADYYPELDTTRNAQVSGTEIEFGDETQDPFAVTDSRGKRLYDSGISALSHSDRDGALDYFRMAWQYRDQLDENDRQDLQSKLTQLNVPQTTATTPNTSNASAGFAQDASPVGGGDELRRQMFSEVLRHRTVAQSMVENRNPRGALNHMRYVRDDVMKSDLDEAGKKQLIAVIEREISEMEDYIQQNLSLIENDEKNARREQEVKIDRENRDEVAKKIVSLVNDYNRLVDERRFEEAEYIARQAYDLDPENPATVLMREKVKLQGNYARYEAVKEEKEAGFINSLHSVDLAARANVTTESPLNIDVNRWDEIETIRDTTVGSGNYKSEREILIWSALKNQTINAAYNVTPLSDVLSDLSERAGVNIIPDTRALDLERVSLDAPVTKNISNPISVESALNIILGDFGLVFKVENESVIITNKQALQARPIAVTYYVGDLVVPIPDFSGNPLNMQFITPQTAQPRNRGFAGGGNDVVPVSYNQQAPQQSLDFGSPSWSGAAMPHTQSTGMPQYNTWGAKTFGQGGVTANDFDELIDLIQETVDPDSWEANGGSGRLRPFPSTLSLIVTQTQENQDRIQSLLTRLRDLNDVQIVVEVRFLTLNDDFFERVGIDLDLQLEDNSGFTQATLPDEASNDGGRFAVGFTPAGATGNLDIPITQNSFASVIPGMLTGNVDAGVTLGFAILSDIEVFFLLQATKSDTRTNVTQAPTVTMFNGQNASVFSGTQQPFVTSIVPVVGDFAAAQQPIITVLPEGTQLNVQAVASADRRFVRMTLVPFFSQIEQVNTFTFEGSTTTRQGGGTDLEDILNAIAGVPDDGLGSDLEIIESGTTVQLPVFANTTVNTTVSVPDGGTVLIGGIKALAEERSEAGVPFLSNVPYVNRFFKNVGISRNTESLMLMVTPRIIIQSEEEANQINTGN